MTAAIKIAGYFIRNRKNAEQRLWERIGAGQLDGLSFERHHPVTPYMADFFCAEKNLVIELDGCQNTPASDLNRAKFFAARGYRVIRISDHDVLDDIQTVLKRIAESASHIPSVRPAQDIEALKAAA
jgi:very-short-patch-repair endonuclease